MTVRSFLLKPWLYLLVIILGTFLKFHKIDNKLFWEDEVSSILYTSGAYRGVIKKSIPVNEIKSISFYEKFLHPSQQHKSIRSEIAGIFSDTHLTPAHYVFLTLWYRITGDTPTDFRLFSVFIFIISLPIIFLFLKALFHSNLSGWIGCSLYAVSPIMNGEAQDTRYYILWVFCFILSGYLFLQSIRINKLTWWILYAVASIIALYTSILSSVFILGHCLYVLLFKRELLTKFALIITVVVLAYLPWFYFLYTQRNTISTGLAWHKFAQPSMLTLNLILGQLVSWLRTFNTLIDFVSLPSLAPFTVFIYIISLLTLGFIIYSIFFLIKKTPVNIAVFLMLMFLPIVLIFYFSDIIRGSFASAFTRYQITNLIVIGFIVTNLLQDKIATGRLLYAGVYFSLVVLGILSILKMENNRCWGVRPDCESNMQEAQLISGSVHPLVITDFAGWGFTNFLAVLNESKQKNADIIYCKGDLPDMKEKIAGKGYSDIFVIQASNSLATKLKGQFGDNVFAQKKEVNPMSPQIWQIKF